MRAAAAAVTAVLVALLAYGASVLTSVPRPYSDEGWVGAFSWSVATGHGRREPLLSDTSLYRGIDHWTSVAGTLPFVAAHLADGSSLTAFRTASFVVGVLSLVLLLAALWRLGPAPALACAALLTASWGFVDTTHLVRWDAAAVFVVSAMLLLAGRGTPSPRRTAVIAALLIVGLDVEPATVALAPGALLLIAGPHAGRRRRLAVFGSALVVFGAAYIALRLLPAPGVARAQFDDVYAAGPYRLPLLRIFSEGSLHPLTAELDRYRAMTLARSNSSVFGTLLLLEAGLAAAVALLAAAGRRLSARAAPAVLLVGYVLTLGLIQGNRSPTYAWYALPLATASVACLLFSEPRPGRPWRRERLVLGGAVLLGAVLAVSGVAGLAGPRPQTFAQAAVFAGVGLAGRRRTATRAWQLAATGTITGLALVGGAALVHTARTTPASPLTSSALAAAARTIAPNETVMGEWQWWYLFGNGQYRANSEIWLIRYSSGVTFAEAFARLCPDVVLLDDDWLDRYAQKTAFPSLAPTVPSEEAQLLATLHRFYRRGAHGEADGDRFAFWHRIAPGCAGQP